MCTRGWYPILVAPLVTVGFILSLYSSAGCQFMNINIGFTPSNRAWNQSEADIGLFFYYNPEISAREENNFIELFHDGCAWYTDAFDETFIEKDRTWKVARIMSLIALAGSFLAAITCWMIALFPLPVGCIWPAIVLPTSMLAFIAEGSKFLIFDIALCRNAVWFPSGIDSLPAQAENCFLGESAYYGIAAGVVHLIGLLSICLKAPEKRRLDPTWGLRKRRPEDISTRDEAEQKDSDSRNGFEDDDEEPSVLDDDIYTPGPSPSSVLRHISQDSNMVDEFVDESSSIGSNDNSESSPGKRSKNLDSVAGATASACSSAPGSASSVNLRISESRLSVMSKMQLNHSSESNDMIDKLISDLDSSLQDSPNLHSTY